VKRFIGLIALVLAANSNAAIYAKFDGIAELPKYIGKVGYVELENGKRIKMKIGEAGIVKSLDKASPKLLQQVCGRKLKFEEVKVTYAKLECR